MFKSAINGLRAVARMLRRDFARSESVLTACFFLRALYFCRIRGALRTMEADRAFPVTIDHNLLRLWKKLNRMELLIKPLSVLEQVEKDAKILVIGPRNEWDLFLLKRSGFDFSRCTGLDLISYSPRIVLGDMHSMPFTTGQFDVVLCGWTISYSAEPATAAGEIARVCKPGGVIGISMEYFDGDEAAERVATGGYTIQDSRLAQRVNSAADALSLFPTAGTVYWAHDAPLKRSMPKDPLPSNCAVLFQNSAAVGDV